MKKYLNKLVLVVIALVALALLVFVVFNKPADAPSSRSSSNNQAEKIADQENEQEFDPTLYSTEEPGSIWWVVNKARPLPNGYVPPSLVVPNVTLRLSRDAEQMRLRQDVAVALENLFTEAEKQGLSMYLASGYRSEGYQKQLYDTYVARDGQAEADRYSARPGTSEHQTGLAADISRTDGECELEICFGTTAEGKWLADNAHKYGFIVRYPEGKENITTYQYEPWHMRFVGKDLANELKQTGLTLEEYFGL